MIIKQLAETLTRLVADGERYPRLIDLAAKSRVSKSTLGRARSGESALRIDNLEDIAKAYGLTSWQMLVPNVDPKTPPILVGMEEKLATWPFENAIPRAQFDALPDDKKREIERFILFTIGAVKSQHEEQFRSAEEAKVQAKRKAS